MAMKKKYDSFADFYRFYLSEHSNPWNRRLHFLGTGLFFFALIWIISTDNWSFLWLPWVCGYLFAWCGHFFIEKNRPATFKYPFYSMWGDFVMFRDMLTGKIPL